MQLIRRITIALAIVGILTLSACGSLFTQPPPPETLSGTIHDIGGQDDSYSIQLEGSDKVWSCYAPNWPVCRLLKKGDTITFTQRSDFGMWNVVRTTQASSG
jgi:hypothetical protein